MLGVHFESDLLQTPPTQISRRNHVTETPPTQTLCQPEATGQQSTAVGFGLPSLALSAALLAQQLPPLTNFSGEYQETEGETGGYWREQFEMVAAICHWDDQAKLVNLVTNSAERSGLCLL